MRKVLLSLLLFVLHGFCDLAEEFKQLGYVEIAERELSSERFDFLYERFDAFVEFLQKNPAWAHKLNSVKERFIRSKERNYYSTDFFGFYDESKNRGQISFYYSILFHDFIRTRYPEFNKAPEIVRFLDACFEAQSPYGALFERKANELGMKTIFSSNYGEVPVLFKVVKYLPSYLAKKPHYDGTAFSLFLDSTDNSSLFLSPYKSAFTIDDFSSPARQFSRESILLIPGTLLAEFSIPPTPHIVVGNGKSRYATIAFAMRPNYISQKNNFSPLPNFMD